MSTDYDWDTYEIFKEQLEIQLPKIEDQILNLSKPSLVQDSLDELFRAFHTYKPNTQYLSLSPFHKLVSKVEDVLSSLKSTNEKTNIVQDSVIEWLLQCLDYMNIWLLEMDKNETQLTTIPSDILNKIQLTDSYVQPLDKLKTLTLLYVDESSQRAKSVVSFLQKKISNILFAKNTQDAENILKTKNIDICIVNLKDNKSLLSSIQKESPKTQIVAIYNSLTTISTKKLLRQGITHTITNPIQPKALFRELVSIVKIFYSSSHVIIRHKQIYSFIQTLQPLPNTIFQILQICDDEEIPVKELIKVVKTDPIIAAHILNVANSPLYGNVELKTIDQAVTKFGKRVIKALAVSGLHNNLGSIDLSAYAITEDVFSKVAMSRLSLMLKWYAKISIADLSILSSTALLGNIGQLLLSKELIRNNQVQEFQELCKSVSIEYAEEVLLCTTTNNISSQILNYWNLPSDISDVISYSNNIAGAPKELEHLCVANYIVYQLIDIQGNIKEEIPDEVLLLMATHSFDPTVLQKALNTFQ